MKPENNFWEDCYKILPYFDYRGRFVVPLFTERRRLPDGRYEYRERKETNDEYWNSRTY